jgi:hypothetical protein
VYHYLVTVGPILYLIEQYESEFKYRWGDTKESGRLYPPGTSLYVIAINNVLEFISGGSIWDLIPVCVDHPYPESVAAANERAAGVPKTVEPYTGEPIELPDDYVATAIWVYATLYSEEKYNEAKDFVVPRGNCPGGEWDGGGHLFMLPLSQRIPPGFVNCGDGMNDLITGDNAFSLYRSTKKNLDLKVFTRPHTKEELQAYGMWPERT